MGKRLQLEPGTKFNRLTVLSQDLERPTHYLCQCDCGTIKLLHGSRIYKGYIKSCGCLVQDRIKEVCGTHLKTHTRLYNIWYHMRNRCNNKNNKDYPYYGGRGITVCDDWNNNFILFETWAINNGYTEKLTIDRIDSNKEYSPNNCKWSTRKEQIINRRPFKSRFFKERLEKSIKQMAEEHNIPTYIVFSRLRLGWSLEDSLNKPIRKKKPCGTPYERFD